MPPACQLETQNHVRFAYDFYLNIEIYTLFFIHYPDLFSETSKSLDFPFHVLELHRVAHLSHATSQENTKIQERKPKQETK